MRLRSVILALVLSCASKPPPAGPPLVCRIDTSLDATKPLVQRALPSPFWFSLLLRGYEATGEVPRPVRDCEGKLVAWTADSCATDAAARPLEAEPLSERDLVISHLGEGRRLVWVLTDRFTNGEAVGPVALAVFDARGVGVTTLGVLRAFPARAQLRLEKLGDGQVLVAEGEACPDAADAKSCLRGVRVVPVGRRHFVPQDLTDPQGRCAGRAFFPMRAEGAVGQGARRKSYRLQTSVSFTPEALAVQEQLTIGEPSAGSESADAAASALSRMTSERRIRYTGGHLVAEGPSLLDRWALQQRGPAE